MCLHVKPTLHLKSVGKKVCAIYYKYDTQFDLITFKKLLLKHSVGHCCGLICCQDTVCLWHDFNI